jgi:hypothetical protein
MPKLFNNLTINGTVPSVSHGCLWADKVNKALYLYGGEFQTTPTDLALWTYDILLDQWNATTPGDDVVGTSYGLRAVDTERGVGYQLGGYIKTSTDVDWTGNDLMLSSLLSFDMTTGIFRNISVENGLRRAEGVMVYLPASDAGLLVAFGGIQQTDSGEIEGIPMTRIDIYDIASGLWYEQNASAGTTDSFSIPDSRRQFCAGATWAEDRSSYNIYLYGGLSTVPGTPGFDDVYILSLPSFTWLRWWSEADTLDSHPKYGMTCNVIDNSQMLIIGGLYEDPLKCDIQNVQGAHNLDLSTQWQKFSLNKTEYLVPSNITAVIEGGPEGGATVKAPMNGGFSANPDLAKYFSLTAPAAVQQPTRVVTAHAASSKNIKAIAIGAGVGGGVLLLLIGIIIGFCCLKKKITKQPVPEAVISGNFTPYSFQQPYSPRPQPAPAYSYELPGESTGHRTPLSLQAHSPLSARLPYPAPSLSPIYQYHELNYQHAQRDEYQNPGSDGMRQAFKLSHPVNEVDGQ